MKNFLKKIASWFVVALMGLTLLPSTFNPTPVFAANTDKASTAILTGCSSAENGGGEGIKCVVLLVVNILSALVGIVGIVGIVVVGIQYLTAGGNEEQTRKAKRRLFEIIIGIAAFVLMSALLNWLLPGFNATSNSTHSLVTTSVGA